MQKLKQLIVNRNHTERDEGTMRFHDYVTVQRRPETLITGANLEQKKIQKQAMIIKHSLLK